MSDDNSKPAIPAWQRPAGQSTTPERTQDVESREQASKSTPNDTSIPGEIDIPSPAEPAAAVAAEEMTSKDATASSQVDHMRTFLEDPAVKRAPKEKVRAFFESKGIAKEQIDEVLAAEETSFKVNDFESFQQTQTQAQAPTPAPQPQSQLPSPPAGVQQRSTAPPIITYPEFLVEAHKPPPLITPGRIVNTAYVVSGLAALIYGASKYLVTPMSDSLNDARHELAVHSQSKIDEMNEKLGTLVSKQPTMDTKKDRAGADREFEDEGDSDSEISDLTELYHRDMGTQTSSHSSRRSSTSSSSFQKPKDALSHSTNVLNILHSHLDELLQKTSDLETSYKDRQDSTNKLRNYLDSLMYSNPNLYSGMWTNPDVELTGKDGKSGNAGKAEEDAVEALKKEIKGVKGVLLSAKRFPGVSGKVGA